VLTFDPTSSPNRTNKVVPLGTTIGCGAGAGAIAPAVLLSGAPPFGFDIFEPAAWDPAVFESEPAVFDPDVFEPDVFDPEVFEPCVDWFWLAELAASSGFLEQPVRPISKMETRHRVRKFMTALRRQKLGWEKPEQEIYSE
jgi:hypothetical protein